MHSSKSINLLFFHSTDTEPPAKILRSTPNYDTVTCIICQKKRWRFGPLRTYNGDNSKLLEQYVDDSSLYERISAAIRHSAEIKYHAKCFRDSTRTQNNQSTCGSATLMEANANSDSPLHTSDPNDYENNIITEAAEILKQELDDIKSKLCNSELEVSWKAAQDILPPKLTKFFCKLTGRHHEVLIASLLQDLIYATCDLRTPKHVALAVEVRHVTGSKELVVTLSKFGHCISYSDLLRIETTSANTMIQTARLLGTYIPPSLAVGKFVYGAADNIDFTECTPDGKSTTHGTNMILCQPSSSCVSSSGNLTNRIVPFVVPPTVAYETLTLEHGGDIYSMIDTTICESYDERVEPKLSHVPASHSDFYLLAEISSESQLWVKARQQNTDTPTRSAYNASRCVIPDVLTNISYLPVSLSSSLFQLIPRQCFAV